MFNESVKERLLASLIFVLNLLSISFILWASGEALKGANEQSSAFDRLLSVDEHHNWIFYVLTNKAMNYKVMIVTADLIVWNI